MARLLCVWFPRWSIQRRLVETTGAEPTDRPDERAAIVYVDRAAKGRFVEACCVRASARGVQAGMPLAEAATRLDASTRLFAHDEEGDRRTLAKLGARFDAFSAMVSVADDTPCESLILDVTGVLRIFGGETPLANEVANFAASLGYRVRIGGGRSLGAAWAASRYLADDGRAALVPSDADDALLALPVEALRLPEATALAFRRLGVETIRQAANLRRDGVKARFGDETLSRLDQLLDRRAEPTAAVAQAPSFEASWSSEFPLAGGEELLAALAALLDRLGDDLRRRARGAVELACVFRDEGGATTTRSLRMCEPVAEPRYLLRMLGLELERAPVRGRIAAIRLKAIESATLLPRQSELFPNRQGRDPKRLGELLDRLGGRLGRENVVRAVPTADAVPERSYSTLPVSEKPPRRRKATPGFPMHQRPIDLLPEPVAIEVVAAYPDGPPRRARYAAARYEILAAHGPERIEAAWWRGETVRRDYWRVETTTGSRFWIFRRLQDGRWFLHGEFA